MTRRFWVGARPDRPAPGRRHGRTCCPASRSQHAVSPRCLDLDPARAGDAGRALGRLAVLRARLGVGREPQPEHVHADRPRHGHRVRLQRRRDARAGSSRPSFRGHGGEVGVYFEAAAVITTLVLLGQVLELRARSRTSGAISALLGLAPKTARGLRRRRAARRTCRSTEVQVGDRLRVRPGEKVPGRRRGARGRERGRRIDGHRRADAGREGAGRPGHRRHGQRHRHAS